MIAWSDLPGRVHFHRAGGSNDRTWNLIADNWLPTESCGALIGQPGVVSRFDHLAACVTPFTLECKPDSIPN